jgi:hypothetical protein
MFHRGEGRYGRGSLVYWKLTNRADWQAALIADRHYTRQSPGSRQFAPPGRCIVLLVPDAPVLWVSSWPKPEYVKHAWAGAWICSLFRNEVPDCYLSSELITQAVAATRAVWGTPPKQGMVTFVNADKVRPKRDPGRCFRKAGFCPVGSTKGGLLALQLIPAHMPSPLAPLGLSVFPFRDMCLVCAEPFLQKERGNTRRYCSDRCRQRACRARVQ